MIHCLCSIKLLKSCSGFASGIWFHLFHMVYSFSSCWVKFIFVKNLFLYRVIITTLTNDHPSSVSLLEKSMIFFSDYRYFPSSSNVELFCMQETKSTTWQSRKKLCNITLRERFHKFERPPVPQNPLIMKDASSATMNTFVV